MSKLGALNSKNRSPDRPYQVKIAQLKQRSNTI